MTARWRTYKPYAASLLIFLGSRLLVLLAIIYAANFVPANQGSGYWNLDSPLRYLLRYDSGWYLRIAVQGYSYNGDNSIEQPVVFYPLYPLVGRFVSKLFGIEPYVGLLIVSNLSILIAIPLALKLIKDDYGTRTALYAIALLSFFPTSLFFSAGYTESLTFLLIVGFFLFLKRDRFVLAATCAGLATGTRPTGIVLLLPLLWELWRRFSREPKLLAVYSLLCATMATSGLWLYTIYLWVAFRSPLAFVTAERAWSQTGEYSQSSYPVQLLICFRFLSSLLRTGIYPITLDPWFFFLFLLLVVFFRKRVPVAYSLFAAGAILLPYLALGGVLKMRSFTRYVMLAFPVFVIIGDQLKGRLWLLLGIVIIFAALLFSYTALFAQWYWAG
jgi:Gpi18-like mannosyltransferase